VVLIAGAYLALDCNLYQVFIFKIPKCDVSFGRFEIVESTLYIRNKIVPVTVYIVGIYSSITSELTRSVRFSFKLLKLSNRFVVFT
jgi:hypothetical protein